MVRDLLFWPAREFSEDVHENNRPRDRIPYPKLSVPFAQEQFCDMPVSHYPTIGMNNKPSATDIYRERVLRVGKKAETDDRPLYVCNDILKRHIWPLRRFLLQR